MLALDRRVKALETRIVPPTTETRVYKVAGVGTEEEMAAFLHAAGWAFNPGTDMIIHIVPMQPDFRDGRVHGAIPSQNDELNRLRLCGCVNPSWRLEAA
ncbi:hypothetical protein [Devosia ginsengisoli]|uniref:hypothetical protein n=1 Tax=Devosia ginsengisoli TaxID=400770 RepID=UPI0026F0667D|nr:hypothetical protein [Devosia ginsengisoli]MCR6671473.1 hypothetical protein [Devosia ginsengisoli]